MNRRNYGEPSPGHAPVPTVSDESQFTEFMAELESGNLDETLEQMEQKLDRVWGLMERILERSRPGSRGVKGEQ